MKRIEAIIRPEKLEILRLQLEKVGYPGMMVSRIEGHGNQRGVTHQFRGQEYKTAFLTKIRIVIVVPDGEAQKLIDAIIEVCRSGSVGDGKIFISEITDAIRIRTGESGDKAIS